jgi:hypothetical protein
MRGDKEALRFFIDRKITAKGGGDHVRVIDVDELDEQKAREIASKKLKANEEIGHVARIIIDHRDLDTHELVR